MTNVYDRLKIFYDENPDAKALFAENTVEKHIRKCAWQGEKEEDLQLRFSLFEKIILYAVDIDLDTVLELLPEDYLEIFYELADIEKMELNESLVKKYITYIEELYIEREEEGFDGKIDEIEALRMFFYDEGKFTLMKPEKKSEYKSKYRRGEASFEEIEARDRIKNNLLNIIERYFETRAAFKEDIKRVRRMFYGDRPVLDKANDFRDYFLFDYHLIHTDETPICYFYREERERFDKEITSIMRELLNSRFTCFYVKYPKDDTFICADMFREREFILPFSTEDFPEYKNMVFYGHIEPGSVPEPTYIGWFSANERLQKRIEDEVIAAYKLYRYIDKKANFTDFFGRHALAVRQILGELTNSFRLNVVPEAADVEIIKIDEDILEDYEDAVKKLAHYAKQANFDIYTIGLLKKYYHDFLVKSKLPRAKNESRTTLLAVIKNFASINSGKEAQYGNYTDEKSVREMSESIKQTLKSEYFDPRYLTEEGFSNLIRFFSNQNNF